MLAILLAVAHVIDQVGRAREHAEDRHRERDALEVPTSSSTPAVIGAASTRRFFVHCLGLAARRRAIAEVRALRACWPATAGSEAANSAEPIANTFSQRETVLLG